MTDQLDVSLPDLATYAAASAGAATRLGVHTARTDVSPLTPTFGIIGAEFLTALAGVLELRRSALRTISGRHVAASTQTSTAAGDYAATDTAAGAQI